VGAVEPRRARQSAPRRSRLLEMWRDGSRRGKTKGKRHVWQAMTKRRGVENRYIFAPLELDATYPGCYAS
jgi:hypothetical protein